MGRPRNDPATVLRERTVRTPDGCLEWQGQRDRDGYGKVTIGGRYLRAHRVAYELLRGPIPEGLVLDHVVCDNPSCCDAWHVEPSTDRANILRGVGAAAVNARKVTCERGHVFDYEWGGMRQCRACQRITYAMRQA